MKKNKFNTGFDEPLKELKRDSHGGIVVSTRVRLARNISQLPFPSKLKDEKATHLVEDVYTALGGERQGYYLHRFLSEREEFLGRVLHEKHLISEDLLANSNFAVAILNGEDTVSIMVLEEDHIRIQAILDGYNLKECYHLATKVEEKLCKKFSFAFDAKLGYLTACPTNVGTGIRASCMMFLPALSLLNSLSECIRAVSKLNMEIRGVYGEGSDSIGFMYQLSNQITLGLSEQQIMDALDLSVRNIEEAELKAREMLKEQNPLVLQDKIQRAYGLLISAYRIESNEFMQAMAYVKLGAYYGYFKMLDLTKFEQLMIDAQPANLQTINGKPFETIDERDVFRAKFIAKELKATVRSLY